MANGKRLHRVLQRAAAQNGEHRIAALRRAVKPYLQLVEGDKQDPFTGYKLLDIWRYFRMTWATPYRSTPGRKLFYLVRDRGQPCHPVMGIAALANCVIGLKCRDDRIGWTPDAIADRLLHARESGPAAVSAVAEEIANLLETHLQAGLEAIALDGLATRNALTHPSWETVAHLQALALTAADERHELLRQEALFAEAIDLEMAIPEAPPSAPPSADRYDRESSKALFRRKRASKLARLLEAKLVMQQKGVFDNPNEGMPALLWNDTAWTMENEQGRSVLRTVLNANKESKVGTSMLEIIVCGAVAPYNNILGGKLTAMLLASPQVVRDYEARYGEQVSMIASQVAGTEVTRPARLAYLGTTSLYVSEADKQRYKTYAADKKTRAAALHEPFHPKSATQYNRLSIPAEVVGGHGEVRYDCIGLTEGFGVVHFSADTRQALEQLDIILHSAKRVNSIFGEGTSPRMRKIRQGIELLGLNDRFLVHGQARLVYGINLAHNTERYLTGQDPEPNYILKARKAGTETDKIAQYWLMRWLASRVNYAPALEAVKDFDAQQAAVSTEFHHSEELRLDV